MPVSKEGYQSALRFILSREYFGMKLGLVNITRFLKVLNNPHNSFPSIHIAGTNGKGSTAAYLDAIFRQAGYKSGLFTSPHLVDFRERIKINGVPIRKSFVTDFVRHHRKMIIRNKITFFEVCTALAFDYFAREKVDIAVIETGLGGRLDATNTLHPLLSIITDISYDHTQILGRTLPKIAGEKAGIIKESVPVLAGILPKEAFNVIRRTASEKNASLSVLRKNDFSLNKKPFSFDYRNGDHDIKNLISSLPGRHQIINAALAIKAVKLIRENNYKIAVSDIREGLKKTDWPGRFQLLKEKGYPLVILDVGHNPGGMKAMVSCFQELFPQRKAHIIIGLVNTKDVRGSVEHLPKIARTVEIASLETDRSADPKKIARYLMKKGIRPHIAGSITTSARKLVSTAGGDDIIIVCGSHYGVGEFLANRKLIYEGKKERK
jgi:dihydrofolate synthase/folylpolyglutamate synthase